MDVSKVFPPAIVQWLLDYALFLAVCLFVLLLMLVLFRPFWLWFSGQGELLERQKQLVADQRKVLFELEMLNKTLSIPLKRAPKKAPEPEPELDTAGFLKALEAKRGQLKKDAEEDGA